MDSVEKKRLRQQRYYRKNIEQIRAKAKVYRENFTPEQRQRKRERGLAYYHRKNKQIRIKQQWKRQNRSEEEKERERQKVRERFENPETQQHHRANFRKYYQNNRVQILARQRQYRAKRVWTKRLSQFEPLHALAEICNREWLQTTIGMCSGVDSNNSRTG